MWIPMDEVNPSDQFTTLSIHTWNNAVFYQTVNVAFCVAGKWHDLTDCEMSLRHNILPLYIQTIVRIVVMFEMLVITHNNFSHLSVTNNNISPQESYWVGIESMIIVKTCVLWPILMLLDSFLGCFMQIINFLEGRKSS